MSCRCMKVRFINLQHCNEDRDVCVFFFFLWLNNSLSFAGRAQSVMWRTPPTRLRCCPSSACVSLWRCLLSSLIFLAAEFQLILLVFEMECTHVHVCGLVGHCSSEMSNIRQRHFCLHSEMSGSVNQSFSATSNTSLFTENYPNMHLLLSTWIFSRFDSVI